MPDGRSTPLTLNTIATVVSLLASLTGLAFLFGEVRGDVRRHGDDIRQLQSDNRAANVTLSEIKTSTARIETKLEILLPTSVVKERDE